ncbi:hypothetical protein [Lysinibacter cavernae]|uniref:Uncharacterized protein n=1 Tax=Lysinibacter cavernae TaxID=1640652 RepID=A0A7X5TTM0_9MICO|nr:hypothetical protein [Lysinibacter cavernae]NIH52777.1 hypothetical protein [Lysinibacter cavernae]
MPLTTSLSLAGCSVRAASTQPEVDAAVVATLPQDFASSSTTLVADSGECLTTVILLPDRYGLSASMVESAIDLLRDGAAEASCHAVLRVLDSDGTQRDMSHIASYLPVEARDGDLIIT